MDFLIATKVKPKKIEHLQHKGIISSELYSKKYVKICNIWLSLCMFTVFLLLLLTRLFAQNSILKMPTTIYHLSIKCQMKLVFLNDILLLLMSMDFIPQMEIFLTISSGFKCHLMWLKSNKVSFWQVPRLFHNNI